MATKTPPGTPSDRSKDEQSPPPSDVIPPEPTKVGSEDEVPSKAPSGDSNADAEQPSPMDSIALLQPETDNKPTRKKQPAKKKSPAAKKKPPGNTKPSPKRKSPVKIKPAAKKRSPVKKRPPAKKKRATKK